jgi:putative transposase
MARKPRDQIEGGTYHVTIRGVRKQPIFADEDDRLGMLMLLDDVTSRYDWVVHGYVLMGNHWHLMLDTAQPSISVGMHRLNNLYARHFNLKYGHEGHLFDRRFFSNVVLSDAQFLGTMRYLANNPVLAGLCRRADEYRWSSFPSLSGLAPKLRFVSHEWLKLISEDAEEALRIFYEEAEVELAYRRAALT